MKAGEVIVILDDMARLLEVVGENPFKVRAHRNAARALETLTEDIGTLAREGRLQQVRGIGAGLAASINTLCETGSLPSYEALKAEVPPTLFDVLRVPGMGPQKSRALINAGITDLDALERAVADGTLAKQPGFGPKTVARVRNGIAFVRRTLGRHLLHHAQGTAEQALQALRSEAAIQRVALAGDLRRGMETIDALLLVAAVSDPDAALDAFTGLGLVVAVSARNADCATITLPVRGGTIPCTLRVCRPERFGCVLHDATGSAAHVTAVQTFAEAQGVAAEAAAIDCPDEDAFFATMKLPSIAPELREGRGEVEAARRGVLPELITERDIRAELHQHSDWSDGLLSLGELVEAGLSRGHTYGGVADHSQFAAYAGGLKPEALRRQHEEIDTLNAAFADRFVLLKSSEVDILADGALDLAGEQLESLDYVVASIHSRFQLDRAAMTRRLIRAIEHPATTIIGHLSGRLLLQRDAYDLAVDEVLAAAVEHRKVLEINANPHRLDIDWRHALEGRRRGALFAVNTDAHRREEYDNLQYGITMARKAWLTADEVINTWPLPRLLAFLRDGG